MAEEINKVKQFFQSNSIILSNEWLASCIDWFKEEHENYTIQELQTQVYEQWLLLDFRDVKIPILPPNINKEKKQIITQSVCLQVMSVMDISKPKLLQIQNIRNNKMLQHSEEEYNVPNKRVLQLTLSDGVQEILATEYKPVPCLNLNLSPGIKVRINAPITVRRGQIMLESNSIKVLGGEIEELLISNAAENVLAASLGMPLNEKPNILQETFDRADTTILNSFGQTNTSRGYNTTTSLQINNSINNVHKQQKQNSISSYLQPKCSATTADPFDDDFESVNFEQIDQIAENHQTHQSQKRSAPKMTTTQFEDEFDSDEFNELMKVDEVKPEPEPVITCPSTGLRKPMRLQKLLEMSITKGKFTIEARFKRIVQKFSISDSSFSIKIGVEDDSGEMDVVLSSDVISEMIGYNPEGLKQLKKQVQSKDMEKMQILTNALESFKDKIVNLNSKMDILIEAQKDPIIIKLLP